MPIRFRCGHCQQLLGIARRKAGTVVTCPNCQQAVIVPPVETVEPVAAARPSAPAEVRQHAGNPVEPRQDNEFVFERSDFDELFRPVLNPPESKKGSKPPTQGPTAAVAVRHASVPSSPDEPPTELGNLSFSDGLTGGPPPLRQESKGIVLTPSKLLLLLALVVGGMIFAFGGGVLLGMFLARS
jgi:hypothetical protein